MARIGNETKLILKLAEERMFSKLAVVVETGEANSGFKNGYKSAVWAYQEMLANIADDLERK